MKITFKSVLRYLYDQLTGNFMGFLIGASATGLVSHFFETRSLRNLWGLTAKKTLVEKDTFQNLEWIISIVIGFVVFEIMTKVVKAKLDQHMPTYKRIFFKWIVREDVRGKIRSTNAEIGQRSTAFFSAVHQGVRQAFNRSSNR
jgi:hypothetical protein